MAELVQRANLPGIDLAEVKKRLEHLMELGMVNSREGFYFTKKRPDWITKRKKNNLRCQKIEKKALRRARLIAKFPFIRAVFFSGTFAKGVMTRSSDVDFFIITAPNRLWLARTLLILYKKIFLLNSRKYFCLNYFVAEGMLAIEERNLFTATEIITMRPALGRNLYELFLEKNQWVKKYYPNFTSRSEFAQELVSPTIKVRLEKSLDGAIGERLDKFFLRKTLNYWKNKFDWMDTNTFDLALKSKTYISKHHPNNFQERVLRKYHFAIEEFEKLHNVRLILLDLV